MQKSDLYNNLRELMVAHDLTLQQCQEQARQILRLQSQIRALTEKRERSRRWAIDLKG
jgi:hypothetical protein